MPKTNQTEKTEKKTTERHQDFRDSTVQTTLADFATMTSDQAIDFLASAKVGLTDKESASRIITYGKNILVEEKKKHWLIHFLEQFKNPLVLILLFAAVFSFATGEHLDAIIVSIIIFASTFLNFFQEYKANNAAQKLREKLKNKAIVIREGKKIEINVTAIVPGDLLFLNAGDLIPADSRVLEAHDFFVNQSSLTGESYPQEKTAEMLSAHDLSLSGLQNMVFSGTNVITGTATALVVKTGKETEFGKIAKDLSLDEGESEFSKGINTFSMLILKMTIFLVLFVFLFNSIAKANVFESFMFAVAVAVGLTPELLPMILSIAMGNGSLRMAEKGVIVKKLSAIPNFGSMDILCTDKTGTLTQDRIELVKYVDCEGNDSRQVLLNAYLNSYYQTGMASPMDDAVLKFQKINIEKCQKIDEVPFDFFRKKMSIVVENQGQRYLITKGAPEEVFKSSVSYHVGKSHHTNANSEPTLRFEAQDHALPLTKESEKKVEALYEKLSAEGYRVLAIATKEIDHPQANLKRPASPADLHDHSNIHEVYSKEDECELTLLGFIAFLDPAKEDVKDVIKKINSMGVEVKIITGDNELVTKKICRELDINVKGILLGHEIDGLTDDALRVVVERTTIFARFSPDEKNRIIHALQMNKHVVGYMGDGINDAPSLKTADVGISVENAVDVAKESADMILTHKSLEELLEGITEGRKTFGNSMKYIMMGISSNFGNMFSVLGAVIVLPFLPMLPIQILLNNLLYDFSQIPLPADHVDEEYVMSPKRWNMSFVKKYMLVFGLLSSLFDFLTFFLLQWVFKVPPALFQTGWFMESLATQVLIIHVIRTSKIPFIQSRANKSLIFTTLAVVVVGWSIPFTSLGKVFGFVSVPAHILLSLAGIVILYLIVVEMGKRIFYRKYQQ